MSTQLDEFSLGSIPFVATPSEVPADSAMAMANDPTMAIGSPAPAHVDPKTITVYANSINPISFSGDADGVAAFDIVFSVGVNCGETSKTYQVVKRIGIDKARIAAEVENAQPMSIVEAKPAPVVEEKKQVITEVQRMRRLAGL
jgi:hypothetical protein